MRSVLTALVLAFSPGVTAAQESGLPGSETTPSNEIEVRGERSLERDQIVKTIRDITTPLDFFEVVPRFHEAVCPRVLGAEPKIARFVEARISAVAAYVGLPAPKKNCDANAFVLMSEQPPEMFEQVVAKHFVLLGPSSIRDLPIDAIRADIKSGKPVVAWNQITTRNYDGTTIYDGGALSSVGGLSFGEGVLVAQTPIASRTRSNIYQAKELAVVVLDMKQLVDVDALQLADFASLYLLGWPRRQIEYDKLQASTMLTLLRSGPRSSPGEMTDFDRAYLKGIYSLSANDLSSQLNRSVMAAYVAECAEPQGNCAPPAAR